MNNFPIIKVLALLPHFFSDIEKEDIAPVEFAPEIIITTTQNLTVPFSSQAPESNWVQPWKDACEEASIVMVEYFYKNQPLDQQRAKQGILNVLKTKEVNFGSSLDENVDLMIKIIDQLGAHFKAYPKLNPTKEDLIYELNAQHPIIVPVYGHELPNPHYSQPPPNYHVIVLIGYDQERDIFKVHDPGTGYGEGMEFSYDTIMEAMHDLKPGDYGAGEKKVIFTFPLEQG